MKIRAVLLLLSVIVGGGCADFGEEPEPDIPLMPPPEATVSYATDVQPVFDAWCVGCHGAGGVVGLDLRAGVSHGNIVEVVATESALNLVEPESPQQSWLYLKITGQQDAGDSMPQGGSLDQASIDLIRTWIEEGAENN